MVSVCKIRDVLAPRIGIKVISYRMALLRRRAPAVGLMIVLCGCESKPPQPPLSEAGGWERHMALPPHESWAHARVWYIERAPARGRYLVELDSRVPLGKHRNADASILMLSGRIKARVAFEEERVIVAGDRLMVPRETNYRLLRVGPRPAVFIITLAPDIRRRRPIEPPVSRAAWP